MEAEPHSLRRQDATERIVLVAPWRRLHVATSEQKFGCHGGSDAGGQLTGGAGGRPGLRCKVQPRWIDQISAMEPLGREADQEPQLLLQFWPALHAEVLFEAHAPRGKSHEDGTHPHWPGSQGRNSEFVA